MNGLHFNSSEWNWPLLWFLSSFWIFWKNRLHMCYHRNRLEISDQSSCCCINHSFAEDMSATLLLGREVETQGFSASNWKVMNLNPITAKKPLLNPWAIPLTLLWGCCGMADLLLCLQLLYWAAILKKQEFAPGFCPKCIKISHKKKVGNPKNHAARCILACCFILYCICQVSETARKIKSHQYVFTADGIICSNGYFCHLTLICCILSLMSAHACP